MRMAIDLILLILFIGGFLATAIALYHGHWNHAAAFALVTLLVDWMFRNGQRYGHH